MDDEEWMEYLRVSRPRHSASRMASVPAMGAQRRSMGGKICLDKYHSMSGLRVEVGAITSPGAYARFAADSEVEMLQEAAEVMM